MHLTALSLITMVIFSIWQTSLKAFLISLMISKSSLTKRENDILKRILSGMKNKEITKELFISSKTVGTHRSNIHSKLHVRTITELYFKLKSDSLIR
ncbi:response regulator transcription factor [Serratia sp. L9]|uniref:response regulator transcription factor n=1 Tax=Serratia sp. L9 TaxID=3423946 RepID=UPI003D674ADD